LWPSSRLDIPAFPLHGSSFKKGVRFSVQTTSCGREPCSSCKFGSMDAGWTPSGSKVLTGLIVRVESMKFRDAQKSPESAFVRANHLVLALLKVSTVSLDICARRSLLVRVSLYPSPQLDAGSALACAVPRPRAPIVHVPPADAEAQMQLLGMGMFQDLAEGAWEVAEVLLLEGLRGGVAAEVEGGEEGVAGERPEEKAFMVIWGAENAGDEREEGGEEPENHGVFGYEVMETLRSSGSDSGQAHQILLRSEGYNN
jgi:hypothetical protein